MLKQALLLNLIFQTFFKAILESNATFCMLFPNNCQTIKYALHSLYYSNCFRQWVPNGFESPTRTLKVFSNAIKDFMVY